MPLLYPRARARRVRFTVAVSALAQVACAAWAQSPLTTTEPGEATLPAVEVQASPIQAERALNMDPVLSRTVVGERQLARRQASTVFGVLDEVPGVSVNGGPRASGMSFNIRGYSDNEDIAVQVDGVVKGFEKYRFGGTFIEPDLIKSLEVRRGAQIESAGALGGTVVASTKDAADLLRPGQTLGARLRVGWASNNNEHHRFAAVYGRPSASLDLLAAQSTRVGNDMRLPDGDTLPLSAVDTGSQLLKASWFPHDDWTLSASWLGYHDQGLQAYDATAGAPGTFGDTQRRIQDETLSLRAQWLAPDDTREWRVTLGQARTRVRDHFEPGVNKTLFANAITGVVNDDIDYQGQTLDTSGRIRLLGAEAGGASLLDLRLGLQAGQQVRSSTRVTANAQINRDLYPGGFNKAQPPGDKQQTGVYLQADWRSGAWQVLPGMRWDRVDIAAAGSTAEALRQAVQATRVSYQRSSPSLVLSHELVPRRWTVFAQWAQAFRPPLMDELYSQNAYGNCNAYSLSNGFRVPGYYTTPGVSNGVSPVPASGICGDLYAMETSRTTEWGVSTRQPGLLGDKSLLSAKLTLFRNRTDNLLESLVAVPNGQGALMQPGVEQRHGAELEAGLEGQSGFATLSYSRIRGHVFDGEVTEPLTSAPGDRLHLSLGWRWRDVEAVLRWQRVGQRLVITGTDKQQRNVIGTQAGYHLLGLSLRWQINRFVDVSLNGENLGNSEYLLNNGFGNGPGTQAPGRNVRLAVSGRY